MPKFCASIGIVFSFAAVILLVFGEIAQINSSKIPRHLRIVSVDTSGLATAMSAAARSAGLSTLTDGNGNFSDIYNMDKVGEGYFVKGDGEGKHDGVRKGYEFGLWSYCTTNGDLGSARSYCLTRTINGPRFRPADILLGDIPEKYSDLLKNVLPENVFTANEYLNDYTRGATYATMAGALAAALTALISLFARRGAFILASLLSIVAFLGLAVGNIIWTVIVERAKEAINGATANGVDVGVTIEYGNALWIMWAATGLMLLSIAPLAISCCVGRK